MIPARQLLVDPLVIYVNWRGSDTNDGLSPQTAVATVQQASIYFATKYDTGGLNHFIFLAAGTYGGFNLFDFVGGGCIEIIGDTGGVYLTGNIQLNDVNSLWKMSSVIFQPVDTYGLIVKNSYIELGDNISFSITQATSPAILLAIMGGIIDMTGNFSLVYTTGILPTFAFIRSNSQLRLYGISITLTGALNWLTAALWVQSGGVIDARSFTISGADPTIGVRWIQESNGIIISDGATEIPGNADGATPLVTQTEPAAFPQASQGFNIKLTLDTAQSG